ncbi:YwbE family protein [Tenacibaculum finnmarkense genomovar ulcerans]|uniref:YwbE family protein n=1 Tax=Tenacibaculum finnmarkense TaxID=2781243 RepID=UPI00187B41B9|nr:YwbE family protein [Tenacibaculum finnmarkense]MBE7688522.1 YwbE family protein [Tenacibaculum finnmarkense genomovar ulcerans]
MKEGTNRKDITIGASVEVIQKNHQKTGELTAGIVSRLLTNSANHPHGIKVQLASGIVGRVQKITAN